MSIAVERDTETLIDNQLQNLDWDDHPKSAKRNVWKQTAKTSQQRMALGRAAPDYVLYQTGTDQPLIVIEAKRPNRNLEKALDQGSDYCRMLNAPIVFASDGVYTKTRYISSGLPLFKDGEKIDEFIRESLALKYVTQGHHEIETRDRKVIKSRNELINVFELANNVLRSDGVQSGRDRFCEFANILFLKLVSEIECEQGNFNSTIPKAFLWDSFRDKHGDELLSFVNDSVLGFFAKKYGHDIFKNLEIRKPTNLKKIIDIIDPLYLTDVSSDIKGDAFEFFLRKYISTHNNDLGEYFTPRHIVKTCVKIANPQVGEKVYDPFCGTGGMLIEAFKHMHSKMIRNQSNNQRLRELSIYGNEITMNYKIAKMNMILMGDGHSNVSRCDSLESLDMAKGKYDVVITNMPFSQSTEHGNLYDVVTDNGNSICVQHCMKCIDPEAERGRVVLICGDDVLVNRNENYDRLREYIFTNSTVHTVISLPPGVFSPYSKTVKTNIVYLTEIKKLKNGGGQKDYWFFKVKKDGFTFATHRKPDKNGQNDLDIYLMHRKSGDHNKFKVVTLDSIKDSGHCMVPFFSSGLQCENAEYLGTITTESKLKAGSDYIMYEVGTVAARARNEGGLVPKKEYYKKEFQSSDRSKYKLVMPGQFVYRKEGADIGNYGWNRCPYPFAVSPIYVVFSIDETRVLHDYLFNVLRSEFFISSAQDLMKGVARAGLPYEDFAKMKIPLPSISKQKEIVNLEQGIDLRVRQIKCLDEKIQDKITGFFLT